MNIEFYRSASGRNYVKRFIKKLNFEEQLRLYAVFEDIKLFGFKSLKCQFRQLDGKLWELKVRVIGSGYRFFYVMLSKEVMMVLHAYKKQSQKMPKRELDVAKRRMKEDLS